MKSESESETKSIRKPVIVLLHTMMLYDVNDVIQWILLPVGEYNYLLTSRLYLTKVWTFLNMTSLHHIQYQAMVSENDQLSQILGKMHWNIW
jgi:hypothetical protein